MQNFNIIFVEQNKRLIVRIGDCGARLNTRLLYVIFEVLEAQTRIRALKVLEGTQSNEHF